MKSEYNGCGVSTTTTTVHNILNGVFKAIRSKLNIGILTEKRCFIRSNICE